MATIQKRGNSYRIKISCGYDPNGKQIIHSQTWTPDPQKTQKQNEKSLQQAAILFEKQVNDGAYLDGSIKFADFAEKWLTGYAEKQLQPKTLHSYKQLLERIIPAIGHIRLDKLQPSHLISFYANLQENGIRGDVKYRAVNGFTDTFKQVQLTKIEFAKKASVSVYVVNSCLSGKNIEKKSAQLVSKALGYDMKILFAPVDNKNVLSSKTILYYHRVISSILSTAVHWQIILANPAERVKPPKVKRKEAKFLDDKQTQKVLELLADEPIKYRTGIALLIYSGLRRGELCGLRWSDINWDNHTIAINRASQYIPGQGIFDKTPKNETSIRTIKLASEIFIILNEYKAWQDSERSKLEDRWIGDDRLFTTWDGGPIHPDTLSDWFSAFVKKKDLPDVTIHSLRHTNATLLISGGVPLKVVADMLGHAQPTTTANIYSHTIKSVEAAAAEVMENILDPTSRKNKKV
ncbi:MAG: tyrosine recombinase XerC [Eubacteriales bacterium]